MPYLKFPTNMTAQEKRYFTPCKELRNVFTIVAQMNDRNGNSKRLVLLYDRHGNVARVIKTSAHANVRYFLEEKGYTKLGSDLFLLPKEYNQIIRDYYVESEEHVMGYKSGSAASTVFFPAPIN